MKVEQFLELAERRKIRPPIKNYWLKTIAAHLRDAVDADVIKPNDTLSGTAIDKLLGLR